MTIRAQFWISAGSEDDSDG